jgi:hypothetical protein
MSGQITAVSAVGEAAGGRAVELYQPARVRPDVERQNQQARGVGLRAGAPADVVELSVDPAAVRHLPENLHLKFLVDPKDGRFVIQIIDSSTDEIIKVVPPSKLREALHQML